MQKNYLFFSQLITSDYRFKFWINKFTYIAKKFKVDFFLVTNGSPNSSNSVIPVIKKMRTCQQVDFAIQVDFTIKLKAKT